MLVLAIILVILLIAWFFWLPYVAQTTKFGAPYVPMEKDVVERVLHLAGLDDTKRVGMPADLPSIVLTKEGAQAKAGDRDIFFDLGSGDGRLVIAAALRGATSFGIEIDKIKVFFSRLKIKFLHLSNARIINGNIFNQNLSSATVVIAYLLPEAQKKLKKKLEKELKPGTKVVAVAFPFPGWKPQTIDPRGTRYGPIYLYIIGKT